ncbi:MAG: dUTP diphosphatase [Candidatus Pacebacteria bacterium CG10_big_fil_rev_8_21_14_0_10_36_11]|nr:MAG: dUTP diphosphatase [Candidatus Pacebacteria bacterium CG10_big_fil_rev_8_21_14_0_10_36_11]PJC43184.1 MAG: dUTP diphosphatase [Candidatus Pacebacteria bacterium CG_4_9_14_0_2_um_filter_36_8]
MGKKKITMKIIIKRFDTSLPMPEYKTSGAAAFDLYVREETTIPAKKVVLVPLNIALQLPENHWALLSARSSLHKQGLMLANGIGVGDYDYRGDGDEYKAALWNFTDEPVVLQKGDRVVQMIVMSRESVEFEEVKKFNTDDRGGFGSTGK